MAIAARLADAARKRGLPIVHAGRHNHLAFNVGIDSPNVDEATGDFAWSLRPRLRDIIVRRQAPSAFFESDLMSFLNLLGADGIIVGGGTTAGAVRATVIDAFSLNLRTVVVADACFDFWEASHALTLFELDSKHSDVSVAKVVEARLRSFPEDLFALPAGEPTEYAR